MNTIKVIIESDSISKIAQGLNAMADVIGGKVTVDPIESTPTDEIEVGPSVPSELNVSPSSAMEPVFNDFGSTQPPPPPPPPAEQTITPAVAEAAVDNRGMRWDDRIHSKERTMNKDNTWRNKRGVDKALLIQVEAELLGAAQAVTPPPPSVQVQGNPPPPPPPPTAHVETPPEAATSQPMTFGEFQQKCFKTGWDVSKLKPILDKHGIEGIGILGSEPTLIAKIATEIWPNG